MALDTRISGQAALDACDAVVDRYDLDTPPGLLRIYDDTAARPAGPDTAISTQVLLATLTMSNPAFGAAADQAPGARATASAITDDTSAAATGTAAFFRGVTGTAFTALIDGEIGTSGADMNLNTLAIVIGATVSITAWTIDMPES